MSIKKLFDLTGKIALVTGGSRGLGLQMAEGLGEMGAKIAITARKKNELDEAVVHLSGMGIEAYPLVTDLQDPAVAEPTVLDVIKRWSRSTYWSTTPAPPGARPPRITRSTHGTK